MKEKKIIDDADERNIEPEFRFRPERLKRVPREKMKVAKRADMAPRNTKLLMSIRLDSDLVAYFRKRAKKPFAAPYQTQINAALRQFMERNPD